MIRGSADRGHITAILFGKARTPNVWQHTSIGRVAVDREFVNIENASQDCAQDHQEDPMAPFWAKMVPKIAKRTPRAIIEQKY